jgi:hypothetical protein
MGLWGVSGLWENGGKEGNGEPVVGGGGGERPAVVRWWWGNDGVVCTWCLEVFGGRETKMRRKEVYGARWKGKEQWPKNRSREGSARVRSNVYRCIRPYSC